MKLDNLVLIYLTAFAEEGRHDITAVSKPDQRTVEGVKAVVRALRDEMSFWWTSCDCCDRNEDVFDEILGDAGNEKVAGDGK